MKGETLDQYPTPPYYTNILGHQVAGSPAATADALRKEESERRKAAYMELCNRREIDQTIQMRKANNRRR